MSEQLSFLGKPVTEPSDSKSMQLDLSEGEDKQQDLQLGFAERIGRMAAIGSDDDASEMVHMIISMAADILASDIHLEAKPQHMSIRMRLDGVLHEFGHIPRAIQNNVVACFKVLSGLSYRSDIPQEGGCSGEDYREGLHLRISTFPSLRGERVAVRLFYPQMRAKGLDSIGLSMDVKKSLEQALRCPDGLILVSGPSGAGKSTTLWACLDNMVQSSKRGRAIVTIEDPIESEIPAVSQSAINEKNGFDFPTALRSLMRQDPEVIMIGEIRDHETASIAVQASLTGHLIMSSIHSSRAAMVPHRMLNMGIAPYALASGLNMIVAQRLIRKLCPSCKARPAESTAQDMPDFAKAGEHIAGACDDCLQTGYLGRVLLSEKLAASEPLAEAIMDQVNRHRFQEIAEQNKNYKSLHQLAWELVAHGITSTYEVHRTLSTMAV